MRLPHRLQGQKVKSQGHGAGAYCGAHLAAQLVTTSTVPDTVVLFQQVVQQSRDKLRVVDKHTVDIKQPQLHRRLS